MKPEAFDAIVLLPRLWVQNANAVSSPLTWGFPAPSAFSGFSHALQRRLAAAGHDIRFVGVGIVCHSFQPEVSRPPGGRSNVFCLTRNPVDQDGATAAIVEEGRAHLEVSLFIAVSGDGCPASEPGCQALAEEIMAIARRMRLAGGSILPHPEHGENPALWLTWPDDHEERLKTFYRFRRRLLPGFALVSREQLLVHHLDTMRQSAPETTTLDALLDLCRLNIEPEPVDGQSTKVAWGVRRRYRGWLVPLPVGYTAISPLYAAGQVKNARDNETPFRFVESVLSLGEWVSPHRISEIEQMFWHHDADPDAGLYRLHNPYSTSAPRNSIA